MADWTIAVDDLMNQRVQHCLLCGALCASTTYTGVWDISPAHSVAYAVHQRCWNLEAARRVMAQRYPTTGGASDGRATHV